MAVTQKIRIGFCTAVRADRGLIDPLFRRIVRHKQFHATLIQLPLDFKQAYDAARNSVLEQGPFSLVFTPFDRQEMLAANIGYLHSHVRTAQIHAGDISTEGSWDDVTRHMITMGSSVQFCVGKNAHMRVVTMLMAMARTVAYTFQIKPLHMDDVQINYSLTPDDVFDVVLYNPPTLRPNLIPEELDTIEKSLVPDRTVIWIEPNQDPYAGPIHERMMRLEDEGKITPMRSVPRAMFLGLLSKCTRAIGNSSSFFTELPYFGKSHVHIGVRNTGREPVEPVTGGSEQIVHILESILL